MSRKWLLEAIVLLLFILFVYAATSKLIDFKRFSFQMDSQPFDDRFTPWLVFGVPLTEFVIAAMLIFKRTLLAGLWASLILMLLFTGYIILIKLNYFGKIPCSCGGVISQLSWTQHLFFNLFFVLISIAGIVLRRKQLQASQHNAMMLS
jgi:hypothetical protein